MRIARRLAGPNALALFAALVVHAAEAHAEETPAVAQAEPPTVDLGIDSEAELGVARPRHVVVADLGLHVVGVGYQLTISPGVSAQLALDAYVPWTENFHVLDGTELESTDVAGVVVRQRFFFYPFGGAPAGFWISPFAQYGLVWATRDGELRSGAAIAGGLTAGYALLISGDFLLSLGGGGQYNAAHVGGGTGSPSFGAFRPTVDILLGYAF